LWICCINYIRRKKEEERRKKENAATKNDKMQPQRTGKMPVPKKNRQDACSTIHLISCGE
jgi:hypothetical protein